MTFCEGGEREGAVSVLFDAREDVEYSVRYGASLFEPDVLRALSAYLFFVKGLPSSTYTLSVNGHLTPIPVPRKSSCIFGGCIGTVGCGGEGRAADGVLFYDLLTPQGICRGTVCENVPLKDFAQVGKSLIRLGAPGGITAAFSLAKLSDGYGICVAQTMSARGLCAPICAAAYLIYRLYGEDKCHIVIGEYESYCTVTPGGVSVFDRNLKVSQVLA